MKIKVSNATNTQLDWLVTDLENFKRYGPKDWLEQRPRAFCPSTNWEQGGPIIEQESIAICKLEDGDWRGQLHAESLGPYCRQYGSTPLIAAMRCYVASKLGDEVEIPKELI